MFNRSIKSFINFSKAIIHYGNGNKISFSDNLYSGWIDMVRYMTLNEKTFYKDGRSSVEKKLDDMLGK